MLAHQCASTIGCPNHRKTVRAQLCWQGNAVGSLYIVETVLSRRVLRKHKEPPGACAPARKRGLGACTLVCKHQEGRKPRRSGLGRPDLTPQSTYCVTRPTIGVPP